MTSKTTDRNGDELVGEILDVIDRSNSQRYKIAVALAEHFRSKYISRERVAAAIGEDDVDDEVYDSWVGGRNSLREELRRELGLQGEIDEH